MDSPGIACVGTGRRTIAADTKFGLRVIGIRARGILLVRAGEPLSVEAALEGRLHLGDCCTLRRGVLRV